MKVPFLVIFMMVYLGYACGPCKIIRLLDIQVSLDPGRFLDGLHRRKVSASSVTVVISSSVWGVRAETPPPPPPITVCELGLVTVRCLHGQSSKHVGWMGVGRGLSVPTW